MISYFYMVKNAGAVSVGVLKASQAIGIFLVSAHEFCDKQLSQCFTYERAFACMVVCAGVVIYSVSKTRRRKGYKRKGYKGKGMGRVEMTKV